LAASAFQILMSSKKPSLPATPSSILDLVLRAISVLRGAEAMF